MHQNTSDSIGLPANSKEVLSVSRDLHFASATDNVIQVWKIKKRSFIPLHTVVAPETVTGLTFLSTQRQGPLLFASLSNKTLVGWSLVDGCCCRVQELPGIARKLSFSSDGEFLAVAIDDETHPEIYLLCQEEGGVSRQKKITALDRVVDLGWHKNSRFVILYESYVHAKDRDGNYLWLRDLYRPPSCLAIHQTKRLMAIAFDDSLWFYSLSGKPLGCLLVERTIVSMVFPRRDLTLVLIDKDRNVKSVFFRQIVL